MGIVIAVLGLGLAGLLALAPIPQDPAYHLFADTRAALGIPNFNDSCPDTPADVGVDAYGCETCGTEPPVDDDPGCPTGDDEARDDEARDDDEDDDEHGKSLFKKRRR